MKSTAPNFRTLDLNLLRVFDQVMAERNLTRAARNLAMTQPAVSNALNRLRAQPEFYNTLANNCTTNIAKHIPELVPGRVPYDYRVLMPGYSDRLAYDLGLLATPYSFEETRRAARVTDLAYEHRNDPDFSQAIRRR